MMHISVKWFGESFNVNLHSKEGVEEFLSIKGCRIKEYEGKTFVGFPAQKNEKSGKWWNHVWGSEKFQAVVLDLARAAKPQTRADAERAVADMADDVPF